MDLEDENETEEKNAVSNLLEKFELPDITATNKKEKIPLALDHRVKLTRKLSAHDHGMMGQANNMYAKQQVDDAFKLALEVIRNCPGCPQPYTLLKSIVEDKGLYSHAHQLGLFIASLDPTTDAETWLDLAKETQNQGMDLTIAISCYRSAYAKSGDGNIKQQMGNLYLKTQQWTLALQSFKQAFKSLSSDRGVEALKHARTMAREIYIFSRKSDPETSDKLKFDALQLLLGTMSNHAAHVNNEDINYSSDLFIQLNMYAECWQHLQDYCQFGPLCDPDEKRYELTSKAAMCLLALNKQKEAASYTDSFVNDENDIESYGDLWFTLAEHYLTMYEQWKEEANEKGSVEPGPLEYVEKALWIIERLLTTDNYQLLLVHLRHADCLEILGKYEEAIESLQTLATLSDEHRIPARQRIARIEALCSGQIETDVKSSFDFDDDQFFADLETSERVEAKFPFDKMSELMERDDGGVGMRRAADLGLYIMTHGFRQQLEPSQMYLYRVADLVETNVNRALEETHPGRYILLNEKMVKLNAIQAELDNVPLVWFGWYRLYREVLGILITVGRHEEALLLAEASLKVRVDSKQKDQDYQYRQQMQSVVLAIALSTRQYDRAYPILKEWIRRDYKTESALDHQWNLFNMITSNTSDVRHHRFLLRLVLTGGETDNNKKGQISKPDPVKVKSRYALYTLVGHVTRDTRSYRYSADSYARAMRARPECPFSRLFLATIYTQIAMQRFTTNRSVASTQAIAFLSEYKELRGADMFTQEIHYNCGRVLHQLGLFTMAVHQYQQVLDADVPSIVNKNKTNVNYCLKSVAAFNMSLIYQQSGNVARSKQLIQRYCRL